MLVKIPEEVPTENVVLSRDIFRPSEKREARGRTGFLEARDVSIFSFRSDKKAMLRADRKGPLPKSKVVWQMKLPLGARVSTMSRAKNINSNSLLSFARAILPRS